MSLEQIPTHPAAPTGVWTRQFDRENDFRQATPITKKIVLCTTPRCGSHFLGHQMHGCGCFGYPLEYLNPGNFKLWKKRAAGDGQSDTLAYIKSVRTGPNGVFAVKLHHEHLSDFLAQEPDPLSYRYIHLQRRDLIKQAVSFARAQQTNAWISEMPEMAEATYDYDLISEKVDAISLGNAGWNAFLRSLDIVPLQLYFEDVREDMDSTLAQIAGYLDIDLAGTPSITPAFAPQRQKMDQRQDWARQFMNDSQQALTAGQQVPGVKQHQLRGALGRKPLQAAYRLIRSARP